MTEHRLTARQVHNKWNRDLVPAVEIDPGDVVVFETQDVSGGQVEPGSPAAALANIDYERIHPLTGPVFVKGARPGDVLEGRDPGTSTRRLGLDGDLASTVHAPAAGVLETTHHALGPVRQSRDETEDGYSHPSRSVLWRHGRRASSSGGHLRAAARPVWGQHGHPPPYSWHDPIPARPDGRGTLLHRRRPRCSWGWRGLQRHRDLNGGLVTFPPPDG
jgi:acetamidase/formamidase